MWATALLGCLWGQKARRKVKRHGCMRCLARKMPATKSPKVAQIIPLCLSHCPCFEAAIDMPDANGTSKDVSIKLFSKKFRIKFRIYFHIARRGSGWQTHSHTHPRRMEGCLISWKWSKTSSCLFAVEGLGFVHRLVRHLGAFSTSHVLTFHDSWLMVTFRDKIVPCWETVHLRLSPEEYKMALEQEIETQRKKLGWSDCSLLRHRVIRLCRFVMIWVRIGCKSFASTVYGELW